jgi:hypothetical protein
MPAGFFADKPRKCKKNVTSTAPGNRAFFLERQCPFRNRIGKVAALIATTLILPILAYAQGSQGGQGDPTLAEVNAVWVLIPVAGAVLLFSARRLYRSKEQT